MIERYTPEEIEQKMEVEVRENVGIIRGELFGVGKYTVGNRRIDRWVRVFDGNLQRRNDYYYRGELFFTDDFRRPFPTSMSYDDDKREVLWGGPHSPDSESVESWAKRYVEGSGFSAIISEDLNESWLDRWEHGISE